MHTWGNQDRRDMVGRLGSHDSRDTVVLLEVDILASGVVCIAAPGGDTLA